MGKENEGEVEEMRCKFCGMDQDSSNEEEEYELGVADGYAGEKCLPQSIAYVKGHQKGSQLRRINAPGEEI